MGKQNISIYYRIHEYNTNEIQPEKKEKKKHQIK